MELWDATLRLSGIFADADPGLQVATCPEWTLSELARHVGGGHRWVQLTKNQIKHLLELNELGTDTSAELVELFSVARSTVDRTIAAYNRCLRFRSDRLPTARQTVNKRAATLPGSSCGGWPR